MPWQIFAVPFIWNIVQLGLGLALGISTIFRGHSGWTTVYAIEVLVTLCVVVWFVLKFQHLTSPTGLIAGCFLQCWLGLITAARVVADTFNPSPKYPEGMPSSVYNAAVHHHDQVGLLLVFIWLSLLILGTILLCVQILRHARAANILATQEVQA